MTTLSRTSPLGARNPAVALLRRAVRHRRDPEVAHFYVIDGPTLAADALDAGVEVVVAYLDADTVPRHAQLAERLDAAGAIVHSVAPGVLARAADTVTCQGVVLLAKRPPAGNPRRAAYTPRAFVLVLDGVSDPGNAGTLIRCADAVEATAVWATAGSVDLFAPKAVRASAGSIFRTPIVDDLDPDTAIGTLGELDIRVLGTVAHGGTPYDRADLTRSCALVLGNEAHGVRDGWNRVVDEWLTIPTGGRVESLNVAMAGTLLAFEAARQRRWAGGNPHAH